MQLRHLRFQSRDERVFGYKMFAFMFFHIHNKQESGEQHHGANNCEYADNLDLEVGQMNSGQMPNKVCGLILNNGGHCSNMQTE